MIHSNYQLAEKEALHLSAFGYPETWIVVDTGTDTAPVYRVWREATVIEQEQKDLTLPHYEPVAYCYDGKVL